MTRGERAIDRLERDLRMVRHYYRCGRMTLDQVRHYERVTERVIAKIKQQEQEVQQ